MRGARRRRAARADRDRRRRHHGRLLRLREGARPALQARDPGLRVDVLATSGSMENLRLVADGRATLAFTAADAAAEAALGGPPFGHRLPIAALARVYDDYMHLVVPASSRVRSIAQLDGRTVSVGPSGSGTRLIAERLLGRRAARAARRRARARRVGRGPARRAHLRVLLVRRPADAGRRRPRPHRTAAAAGARRTARRPPGPLRRRLPRRRHPQRDLRIDAAGGDDRGPEPARHRRAGRRRAGPARHRDAIRAARVDRPRRPGRRRARPPRRDRDRPRCRCIPPPWIGTATPRPEPHRDPRGASPPWAPPPACRGIHGSSVDPGWMKHRRASSPRCRGTAARASRRSARAACGRSRGRGPSRRRSGAGARARTGRRRGAARPGRGRDPRRARRRPCRPRRAQP